MAALTLPPSYEVSYKRHNVISRPPDELLAVAGDKIDIGATTELHAKKHTYKVMKLGREVGRLCHIIWFSRLSVRQYRAKYACLYHTQVAIEPF
jgi:hypothetical protein